MIPAFPENVHTFLPLDLDLGPQARPHQET